MPVRTLCAALLWALSPVAFAVSNTFTYQGQLLDGNALATGTYDLQFQLQTAAGANVGPPLSRDDVSVVGGTFAVELDFATSITGADFRLLIGVRPGAATGAFTLLSPPTPIRPAPQAQVAGLAAEAVTVSTNAVTSLSVADGQLVAADINPTSIQRRVAGSCAAGASIRTISEDGSVSCENDDVGADWRLNGNAATNPANDFIGTTDAQDFVIRTQNVPSLRLQPSAIQLAGTPITANVIAGASSNAVSSGVRGATIAGGGVLGGASDPDFAFEAPNRVTDAYGSVGGGYHNRAGDDAGSTVDRAFATVGGGILNTASGGSSSIGGGEVNTATGASSVIGGGISNTASAITSTIGGGDSNLASATASTIAGGRDNVASGGISTIGGGDSNTASIFASTVSGGLVNVASGDYSTVSGGERNIASGSFSTVSGGQFNCAGGQYSWSGGRRAKARPGTGNLACAGVPSSNDADGDNGTFVWADSQSADFVSTGANQFLVRAAGGMAINTNTPVAGAALTVNGNQDVTGSVRFGAQTRQMLELWSLAPESTYAIGVQGGRLYQRAASNGGFNWFVGGLHSDATDNPGIGGFLRMHLSTAGQLQTTTGTISVLSDARLKDQVTDYSGALDRINALRPVRYHYANAGKSAFQPDGEHLGFIAQEMQPVFPEWVSPGEDGYLMLSMRGFEAVAVRALQELSAAQNFQLQTDARHGKALDQLNTENAQLRAQLAELAARLQALENQ